MCSHVTDGHKSASNVEYVGGGGRPLQRHNSEEMGPGNIFHKFTSMMVFFNIFIILFEKGYKHLLSYNIF